MVSVYSFVLSAIIENIIVVLFNCFIDTNYAANIIVGSFNGQGFIL